MKDLGRFKHFLNIDFIQGNEIRMNQTVNIIHIKDTGAKGQGQPRVSKSETLKCGETLKGQSKEIQ